MGAHIPHQRRDRSQEGRAALMDQWITKCGMDGPDNHPYGNLADEF